MNPLDQPTPHAGTPEWPKPFAGTPTPTLAPTPRAQKQLLPINSHTLPGDVVYADFARTLERELAAAKEERDLNITRVASILWSGAIDKHTCGDVQKWADDYTAELTRLRAEVERWQGTAATMSQEREHNANAASRLRAQLAAIEEDGTEEHNAAVGLRQKLVAALARAEKAEAERAALAKDKARLDWMLENVGKHYSPMCHDRAAIDAFL